MDLITLVDLQDYTLVDTPLEVNLKLRNDDGTLLPDPHMYRRLVGSQVYLTITRPDISYVVNLVSHFMSAPQHLHPTAMKRIIQYLLGTSTSGLFFPKGTPTHLTAYADENWACCPNTRLSKTGGACILVTP